MAKIPYTLKIDSDLLQALKCYCEQHRELSVSSFIRTAVVEKLKSLQHNTNQHQSPHNVLLDQWRREEQIDQDKKRQAGHVVQNTGWLPQDERPRWRR
jgi:hypothetical protein